MLCRQHKIEKFFVYVRYTRETKKKVQHFYNIANTYIDVFFPYLILLRYNLARYETYKLILQNENILADQKKIFDISL